MLFLRSSPAAPALKPIIFRLAHCRWWTQVKKCYTQRMPLWVEPGPSFRRQETCAPMLAFGRSFRCNVRGSAGTLPLWRPSWPFIGGYIGGVARTVIARLAT